MPRIVMIHAQTVTEEQLL